MMLAEARAKYEQALASWEHPELRLYLGRALASIGLPLLASPSCMPSARDEYEGSVLEDRLAIGALIAGGASAITGTVLLLMNRPQSYRTEDRGGVKLEILPAASLDAAMLWARFVL